MDVLIVYCISFQPGECICKTGWSGADCNQCIPYWACPEKGPENCNLPNECICFNTVDNFLCNNTKTDTGNLRINLKSVSLESMPFTLWNKSFNSKKIQPNLIPSKMIPIG